MNRFAFIVGMLTISVSMAGCSCDTKSINQTQALRALKPGGGGQLQPFNTVTGRNIPGKYVIVKNAGQHTQHNSSQDKFYQRY